MIARYWWIAALVVPGGCLIALAVLAAKRMRALPPDPIDSLIVPPRQVFVGHDEALEQRTRVRRERAAEIKADGLKLDTRDDSRSKIHMVSR